jgi:LPPG:FO 2-phospho-L-lactate transferase
MREFGIPVSAAAIARHYLGLIDGFVIDTVDAGEGGAVEAEGIICRAVRTVMESLDDRIALARHVVDFIRHLQEQQRGPCAHVDSVAG